MNFFQKLDASLSTFHQATDVALILQDETGKTISAYGEDARFCQMFAQATGERCPCMVKHLDAARLAQHLGSDYIWTCPAGLVHFSVAITRGKTLLGNVLAGPVLLDYPDPTAVDEMLQQYELPFSMRRQFCAALNEVPLIEPKRASSVSKLLFLLVTGPFREETRFTSLQQEKALQQSKISEYIQAASQQPEISDGMYAQEQTLIQYILAGNESQAQEVLNQILGNMYYSAGNNLDIIRVRVIELFGTLSRALIRAGMNPREAYGLVDSFQHQCMDAKDLESLAFLLLATVKKMSSLSFCQLDEGVSPAIRSCIQYINQNYSEHLTLDQVAGVAALSPTYLSGLFKAEVGQNFTEYVVQLRLERAKQLLRQTDLPLADIAQMVGFDTQQYFNRVFKQKTGQTPLQYRNHLSGE
jgi:YesN/AraC family two-component response regulator